MCRGTEKILPRRLISLTCLNATPRLTLSTLDRTLPFLSIERDAQPPTKDKVVLTTRSDASTMVCPKGSQSPFRAPSDVQKALMQTIGRSMKGSATSFSVQRTMWGH